MGRFAVKVIGILSNENPLLMKVAGYFFETRPARREAEALEEQRLDAEREEWMCGVREQIAEAQERDRQLASGRLNG